MDQNTRKFIQDTIEGFGKKKKSITPGTNTNYRPILSELNHSNTQKNQNNKHQKQLFMGLDHTVSNKTLKLKSQSNWKVLDTPVINSASKEHEHTLSYMNKSIHHSRPETKKCTELQEHQSLQLPEVPSDISCYKYCAVFVPYPTENNTFVPVIKKKIKQRLAMVYPLNIARLYASQISIWDVITTQSTEPREIHIVGPTGSGKTTTVILSFLDTFHSINSLIYSCILCIVPNSNIAFEYNWILSAICPALRGISVFQTILTETTLLNLGPPHENKHSHQVYIINQSFLKELLSNESRTALIFFAILNNLTAIIVDDILFELSTQSIAFCASHLAHSPQQKIFIGQNSQHSIITANTINKLFSSHKEKSIKIQTIDMERSTSQNDTTSIRHKDMSILNNMIMFKYQISKDQSRTDLLRLLCCSKLRIQDGKVIPIKQNMNNHSLEGNRVIIVCNSTQEAQHMSENLIKEPTGFPITTVISGTNEVETSSFFQIETYPTIMCSDKLLSNQKNIPIPDLVIHLHPPVYIPQFFFMYDSFLPCNNFDGINQQSKTAIIYTKGEAPIMTALESAYFTQFHSKTLSFPYLHLECDSLVPVASKKTSTHALQQSHKDTCVLFHDPFKQQIRTLFHLRQLLLQVFSEKNICFIHTIQVTKKGFYVHLPSDMAKILINYVSNNTQLYATVVSCMPSPTSSPTTLKQSRISTRDAPFTRRHSDCLNDSDEENEQSILTKKRSRKNNNERRRFSRTKNGHQKTQSKRPPWRIK